MSRTNSALLALLCALALLAGVSAAAAQMPRPDPKDAERAVPGAAVPETTPPETSGQAPAESLSDRLERSKGVIHPPGDVDPEIHVSPPEATHDPMPVIPPPGSPGGDQRVQPK
jgi:hypothetical protein